ncbi:MAG: hypothetical protein GC157_02500 [Frankiales bacterium]|nr:hypothetical protein [Frankiales bacterium]
MSGRRAHLVGSLPGDSAREAMTTALEKLGPHVVSLPDGETGPRRNWIIHIIGSLRAHPDLELVRNGTWSDYDDIPRFKVRKGHRLYGASLDFGHVAAVTASLPVFDEVTAELGRDDVVFQVGTPGDTDMALFTLGPVAGLRQRRAFTEATLHEVRAVQRITGGKAVFQIEVPAELVLVAQAPGPAQAALARVLGGRIAALAGGAAPGTRFGVHLCLGDMNHKALGRMGDAGPLVQLANAVARAWPAGRPLEFVHAPFAAADDPPPLDPAFYAPLSGLRLGPSTRFVAGIAHEGQSLAEQLRLRTVVEDTVGSRVDISTSCGLGRRERGAALAALDRIGDLCAD